MVCAFPASKWIKEPKWINSKQPCLTQNNKFFQTPSNPSLAQIQEQQPKFDPTTHHFSPEELKPTPIQKKSRKQLVRDEDKDEKYWDKVRPL